MKLVAPTAEHKAFRDDLVALLAKHGGHLSSTEMLALAAYVVGQIAALADQRRITSEEAMELIARNIEEGNAHAISGLMHTAGSG